VATLAVACAPGRPVILADRGAGSQVAVATVRFQPEVQPGPLRGSKEDAAADGALEAIQICNPGSDSVLGLLYAVVCLPVASAIGAGIGSAASESPTAQQMDQERARVLQAV
jgi:hypothetical protein